VRNEDEIAYTGKLSDCVETLPLPLIAQMGAFNMSEEDFEDSFGFAKPQKDETIVFTCKAGIRSMHAAQYAAMNGYSNLINYTGGAMDWFR
jgi:Rhodanese-related sulfurtransferase